MLKKQEIKVDLGNGVTLVAEFDGNQSMPEITIGLEKNGSYFQDLAVIGSDWEVKNVISTNDKLILHPERISMKVYSDAESEDYTHDFKVPVFEPEDECD